MTNEMCPFCGGDPVVEFSHKRNGWKAQCENRNTPKYPMNMRTHYHFSEEEALKAWNTRYHIIIQELREALMRHDSKIDELTKVTPDQLRHTNMYKEKP